MPIELPDHLRKTAIASIQRYFDRNLPEPIGDLPAGMLLDFFLEDIAPAVYNKAVTDAQTRMHGRIAEIDSELYEDPFQYWHRLEKKQKKSR